MDKDKVLKDVKLFVLDMDGTVYLGNRLIPGAKDFLNAIDTLKDKDYIFFTNNASRVSRVYVEKLRALGIQVSEEKILTAGDVCREFLKKEYPGKRVYLNGTKLLEDDWRKKGINLVSNNPDVAVQSFDTTLTYEKLERICTFVREGVPFLATHKDINCPTEDGFIPDCGAMCALITASTGVNPTFFGKPSKETVDMISLITNEAVDNMAFVGDRLYTDVACGVNNKAKGFLVLTGESSMDTVEKSEVKPTEIFESLGEMTKYL